jgi:hypothetical protein
MAKAKPTAKPALPTHINAIYRRMMKGGEISSEDFATLSAFAYEQLKGKQINHLAWHLFEVAGRSALGLTGVSHG